MEITVTCSLLIQKFQTAGTGCATAPTLLLLYGRNCIAQVSHDTLPLLNMRGAVRCRQLRHLSPSLRQCATSSPARNRTQRHFFGDYVSIPRPFQQSVEDGATVRLFYENRTPELQLVNPDLNEDIYNVIEAAQLDSEQETKLERELGRTTYHILTRDDRLGDGSPGHRAEFHGRGFIGKAMVVSIDKGATALKISTDKVLEALVAEETARVQKELSRLDLTAAEQQSLRQRLGILQTTDMALIVSPEQNEVTKMQAHGLDIVPHRQRMNNEALDEKFKDPNDPLRLVFLCAMWLTGFDAPSCSTVYLDKPMRNHTLMQTIARANRVFPGKYNGVIVDYANRFRFPRKGAGYLRRFIRQRRQSAKVKDKKELVEALRKSLEAVTLFCADKGVMLDAIEQLPAGDMRRLAHIADAVDAVISPDPLRREFLGHERLVSTLYKARSSARSGGIEVCRQAASPVLRPSQARSAPSSTRIQQTFRA